jgi:tetratricopeptide (TPR) repeat protein
LNLRAALVLLLGVGVPFAAPQNVSPEIQAKITPIFNNARAAERIGDLNKAARLYDEILRLAPGVAEIWTNKGLVLLQLERHREALTAFEKARSINPRLVVPHIFAGVEYLRDGRAREAIVALEQAVELEPTNTKATYELGRAYVAVEAYDRATSVLASVIAKDPNTEDAWFTLGLAYLNWSRNYAKLLAAGTSPYGALIQAEADSITGLSDPAREKYRSAVARLTPEERAELPVDPHTYRITPGAPLADSFDAKWIGLEPGEKNLNAAAARAWNSGRFHRALQAATRATAQPRGQYWASLACRALARETLLRAVQRYPESARAQLVMAQMAKDDGDDARALAAIEEAAKADPLNVEVQLMQIQFLAMLRNDDLLPRVRDAAKAFPKDARIQCEFGKALLKNGAPEEALTAFRAATASDPGLTAARVGMADAHAALGHMEAAIAEMRKVLAKDTDGSYHYRIGRWYQQVGKAQQARVAFAETARIKAKTIARLTEQLTGVPAPR